MGMDSMMLFRTAYLRAIAKAWNNEHFFNRMTDCNAVGYDGWKILEECVDPPPCLPPWGIRLFFREDQYPGNGYHPELTGSWVGPQPIIRLRLPPPPARALPVPEAQAEQAKALAAYYAAMPTPFGYQARGKDAVQAQSALGTSMGPWVDALLLGATVVHALALSWNDELFNSQFFGSEALLVLRNWLGYNLPWNMRIEAEGVKHDEAKWDVEQQQWQIRDGQKWTAGVPANSLTLFVPNRPKPGFQAVALASYNQTGPAYPLTCP